MTKQEIKNYVQEYVRRKNAPASADLAEALDEIVDAIPEGGGSIPSLQAVSEAGSSSTLSLFAKDFFATGLLAGKALMLPVTVEDIQTNVDPSVRLYAFPSNGAKTGIRLKNSSIAIEGRDNKTSDIILNATEAREYALRDMNGYFAFTSDFDAGTYEPYLEANGGQPPTNVENIEVYPCHWTRINKTVTVTGKIKFDVLDFNTPFWFSLPLPIKKTGGMPSATDSVKGVFTAILNPSGSISGGFYHFGIGMEFSYPYDIQTPLTDVTYNFTFSYITV